MTPMEELREQAAKIICDFTAQHQWDDMANDRTQLREFVRQGCYDVNEPTKDDCLQAADKILSALPAPVALPQAGAVEEMIQQFNQLADKEEGVGMSYSMPCGGGIGSFNVYGRRAKAAIWLFNNARRIANALSAPTPTETPTAAAPDDGLRALREPTEAMLDASWKLTGESKEMRPRTHAHYKRHWQAMIDAALSTATSDEGGGA